MNNDQSETFADYLKSRIGDPNSAARPGYDTIVIGAGLAGLTAACLLARAGQKVLVTAAGGGSLLLASGCIDVLGYQPVSSTNPVKNPLNKLINFLADHPEHPYRLIGAAGIKSGLDAFARLVSPLDYRGNAEFNWQLPGAAGAVHPTCLAPTSLASGELSNGGRMLIAGFHELRDFYPALISQNLNAQKLGVQTRAVTLNLPAPLSGKVNVTPIELAQAFEQPKFRQRLVKLVNARGYSRIGFPAVLGLDRHAEVRADLEEQFGKTVFEISTLPPSVPGRRLFDTLKRILIQAGGRIILGGKVVNGSIKEGLVTHVNLETANRLRKLSASNFVLATGGIYGGGIQTDSDGQLWEPIFDLPVTGEANRHRWFAPKFITPEGHPFARFGIRVNSQFNPIGGNTVIAKNLFVAGNSLAGVNWVQGRTGSGVAVSSAAAIVEQIMIQ